MGKRLGQVPVPAELRADVSAHGFWKWETTAMFDIIIVNLDVISYLCMTPKKDLVKADKYKKDLYLQACLERRRYFDLMVYSTDGIHKEEELAEQSRLAALIRFKLK